jgi:RNA-binding protein
MSESELNAPLGSADRKWLRGKAHHLDPLVNLGKGGLTDGVVGAVDEALLTHELVKVRFQEFKQEKKSLAEALAESLRADLVGVIGNVAILFRAHPDPEKRKIEVPGREG